MSEALVEDDSRARRWLSSAAVGLLAAAFLASGLAKLAGLEAMVEAFEGWGYPAWALSAVGGAEVLATAALLVPGVRVLGRPLRLWGALGLTTIMLGALGTHLVHGEYASLVAPAVLLALASWVALRTARGDRASAASS